MRVHNPPPKLAVVGPSSDSHGVKDHQSAPCPPWPTGEEDARHGQQPSGETLHLDVTQPTTEPEEDARHGQQPSSETPHLDVPQPSLGPEASGYRLFCPAVAVAHRSAPPLNYDSADEPPLNYDSTDDVVPSPSPPPPKRIRLPTRPFVRSTLDDVMAEDEDVPAPIHEGSDDSEESLLDQAVLALDRQRAPAAQASHGAGGKTTSGAPKSGVKPSTSAAPRPPPCPSSPQRITPAHQPQFVDLVEEEELQPEHRQELTPPLPALPPASGLAQQNESCGVDAQRGAGSQSPLQTPASGFVQHSSPRAEGYDGEADREAESQPYTQAAVLQQNSPPACRQFVEDDVEDDSPLHVPCAPRFSYDSRLPMEQQQQGSSSLPSHNPHRGAEVPNPAPSVPRQAPAYPQQRLQQPSQPPNHSHSSFPDRTPSLPRQSPTQQPFPQSSQLPTNSYNGTTNPLLSRHTPSQPPFPQSSQPVSHRYNDPTAPSQHSAPWLPTPYPMPQPSQPPNHNYNNSYTGPAARAPWTVPAPAPSRPRPSQSIQQPTSQRIQYPAQHLNQQPIQQSMLQQQPYSPLPSTSYGHPPRTPQPLPQHYGSRQAPWQKTQQPQPQPYGAAPNRFAQPPWKSVQQPTQQPSGTASSFSQQAAWQNSHQPTQQHNGTAARDPAPFDTLPQRPRPVPQTTPQPIQQPSSGFAPRGANGSDEWVRPVDTSRAAPRPPAPQQQLDILPQRPRAVIAYAPEPHPSLSNASLVGVASVPLHSSLSPRGPPSSISSSSPLPAGVSSVSSLPHSGYVTPCAFAAAFLRIAGPAGRRAVLTCCVDEWAAAAAGSHEESRCRSQVRQQRTIVDIHIRLKRCSRAV